MKKIIAFCTRSFFYNGRDSESPVVFFLYINSGQKEFEEIEEGTKGKGDCTVFLLASGGQPGLRRGYRILCGRQRFVAVGRIGALGGCHGVVHRRARRHSNR